MHFEPRFDAAFALEIAAGGYFDEPLARAIDASLKPGGRFAVTLASLDGAASPRIHDAIRLTQRRFRDVGIDDWTSRAAHVATITYRAWLAFEGWHPAIRANVRREARRVLNAIARGRFNYAVVTGAANRLHAAPTEGRMQRPGV